MPSELGGPHERHDFMYHTQVLVERYQNKEG